MHQAKSLVSKDALISEILSRDKSEIESLRWIFSVDNNVAFQYFSNGGNDRYPINKIDLSVFLMQFNPIPIDMLDTKSSARYGVSILGVNRV